MAARRKEGEKAKEKAEHTLIMRVPHGRRTKSTSNPFTGRETEKPRDLSRHAADLKGRKNARVSNNLQAVSRGPKIHLPERY